MFLYLLLRHKFEKKKKNWKFGYLMSLTLVNFPIMFQYGLQWTKSNLYQKIHCVFVDVSERVALLSRRKIDVKEDITL